MYLFKMSNFILLCTTFPYLQLFYLVYKTGQGPKQENEQYIISYDNNNK